MGSNTQRITVVKDNGEWMLVMRQHNSNSQSHHHHHHQSRTLASLLRQHTHLLEDQQCKGDPITLLHLGMVSHHRTVHRSDLTPHLQVLTPRLRLHAMATAMAVKVGDTGADFAVGVLLSQKEAYGALLPVQAHAFSMWCDCRCSI